ncbi:MAG: DUF87 domain-containing protein [Gammaproteobacteria bacterium]|nr:DUF87 domain-containing protein [Gammaproteobacteria bacterium]
MFLREYKKHPTKKALEKLRCHRGLNDLLTYGMLLDSQTVLHKDGALSVHFHLELPDLGHAGDEALNFHASTWAESLKFLTDGFMVEVNVLSQPHRYYPDSREFPELVSALMDDERRLAVKDHTYFKTVTVLSVTCKPPASLAPALKQFAFTDMTEVKDNNSHANLAALCDARVTADWLRTLPTLPREFAGFFELFYQRVDEYVGFLARALVEIKPLEGDVLATFLHQCLSGQFTKLVAPYRGAFLDAYLVGDDFIGGLTPKLGQRFIKALAIDDLPSESYPIILNRLSALPLAYRWSNRLVPLEPLTTQKYLKRYERSWSSKAIGVFGVLREAMGLLPKRNEDAQNTVDQLKCAQLDNMHGDLRFGFYNSTLILMDENLERLNQVVRDLKNDIQQLNFRVREESINAVESFLGSLPSHGGYNLRKMLVDGNFWGDALPISQTYLGKSVAPCPKKGYQNQPALLLTKTQGDRPFFLNLHVGDVGHTAILGPTGTGKSTLVGALIAAHRQYPGSRIVVLDKDYSNRLMVKALNGHYYDLNRQEMALAPLAGVGDSVFAMGQAVAWLSDCCRLQGVTITPAKTQALQAAVKRLAHEEPMYKNLNHLTVQEESLREALAVLNSGRYQMLLNGTASDFFMPSENDTSENKEVEKPGQWNEENKISKKDKKSVDVMGIEMGALMDETLSNSHLNLPVIKALFLQLEVLFLDQRPTLLILEEAWLYLKHPLFREKLTDWFKTLRKKNVAVIFVSQDLSDIAKSDVASTLQSACLTRIYLPNAAALESAIQTHYEAFGLTPEQITAIANGAPKKDYFYQASGRFRGFELGLGSLSKSFICVSDKSVLHQFEQCYQVDDSRWVVSWLMAQGHTDWADFAKTHYFSPTDLSIERGRCDE